MIKITDLSPPPSLPPTKSGRKGVGGGGGGCEIRDEGEGGVNPSISQPPPPPQTSLTKSYTAL